METRSLALGEDGLSLDHTFQPILLVGSGSWPWVYIYPYYWVCPSCAEMIVEQGHLVLWVDFADSLLFYPEFPLFSCCNTNPTILSSSILVVDPNTWSILALSYTMIRVCIAGLISLIRPESLFQISTFFCRRQKEISSRFCCIYSFKLNNPLLSLFYIFLNIIIILRRLEIKWFMVYLSAPAYTRAQNNDRFNYLYLCQYKCWGSKH